MKKLWKQDWLFYIGVFVILTLCFCVKGHFKIYNCFGDLNWFLENYSGGENEELVRVNVVGFVGYGLVDISMLEFWISAGCIALLVLKTFFWMLELGPSGRCFMESLPVTRKERKLFHIRMDAFVVIASISCSCIYTYQAIAWIHKTEPIVIPGLSRMYLGEAITASAYLLFFLSLLNIIEVLFAGGFMQIVGTVSCICMGNISLSYLAEVFQKSYLLQNLEGFFHASQAGNCYYGEEGWMHEGMELQFNVGKRSFLLPKGYGLENDYMNRTLYRFLDMANPSSYLPSVFAYLLLSVLLLIFAISLTNNREISKELFCFEAGRYLLCGLVAVTVFAILAAMGGIEHIWYVICICLCSILAAVRLYLALQDKRDAERISFFAKKAK